jgi:trehalose 6-phosphate synthase
MRATLALLCPLLAVLTAIAWIATVVVERTGRAWFDRDTRLRAELAVAGAHEGLAEPLRRGERARVGRILGELARDDRVRGAAACDADGAPVAATPLFPAELGCDRIAPRVAAEGGAWDLEDPARGGRLHVTAVPLSGEAGPAGMVVLVHEMGWVAGREATTRRFTWLAFGLVAVAAAIATTLAARVSWAGWTAELRRLLRAGLLLGREEPLPRARRRFQPVLADLRALAADLAAAQAEGRTAQWSPERLRDALARHLPGSEVIVVANREPFIHERGPEGAIRVSHPASGLVTALEPVIGACSGTWIAHGGGAADREVVDRQDRIRVPPESPTYTLRRVWLSEAEEEGYYYGFANEGLWPLCHMAHTRPTFRESDWQHYRAVNALFADAVAEEARRPDPVVLVQDYHFALLPRLVRQRLPRATVITFWHIPWPNAERFGICPWGPEILEGLLGSSILGFHVQGHCNNLLDSVDRTLEARIDRERQSVVLGGQEALVRAYPISIDWPTRWVAEAPSVAACRARVLADLGLADDALLGVGVDRLDYTKGIEERLLAVERLLDRFPQLRRRFTFVQLAAPSRTRIPRYQELARSVDALAERVNARFGDARYRPVVLLREHHEPPAVFRYYRAADVCYVSSLHDGMNLVAKEFVAAREDEAGVLVLSRFTGASRELSDALLVNPYDLEEASAALAAAVTMPHAEQRERMRSLRALVAEFNVYRWAGRMLVDAGRLRKRDRLGSRITVPLRGVAAEAAARHPR